MVNRFETFPPAAEQNLNSNELPPDAEEVVSEELKSFRTEMKSLQSNEGVVNENLARVDVTELMDVDAKIWNDLQSLLAQEGLSKAGAQKFYDGFGTYHYGAKMAGGSREYFAAYVADKSMELLRKSGY